MKENKYIFKSHVLFLPTTLNKSYKINYFNLSILIRFSNT